MMTNERPHTIIQQLEIQIDNYRKSQESGNALMRAVFQTHIDGLLERIEEMKKNLPVE
jgi:hypothetical protein